MKKLMIFASVFTFAFAVQSFKSNANVTAAGGCSGAGECRIEYPDGRVVQSTGSWSEAIN